MYLLNHNSSSHQTWSVDRYKQGQLFSAIFRTIGRTGAKLQVLLNLATYSDSSITNNVKILVFHFSEDVNKRNFKMVNVNYLIESDLAILLY